MSSRLRWLAALVAAAVLWATPAYADLDPAAHAGEAPGYVDHDPYLERATGPRPSYMMIGDSITYGGTPYLRGRGVGWEITSIPGRNCSTMPYYVADRMRNPSPLRTLVLALCTNADVPVDEATDFYRQVAAMVPATTRIVWVTTYRGPIYNGDGDFRRRAWVQARYSGSMRTVAAERPHSCVVEWRDAVKRHPEWLRDYVHPSPVGYRYGWTPMVQRGALDCR